MSSLLDAPIGYLQLGMPKEANEEIEALPPEMKVLPEVIRLRAHIYFELKAWELLREVAKYLTHAAPEDPQNWIWLAYATRRVASISEAEGIMLNALEFHPDHAIIQYNLACYSSQGGRLDEARQWLKQSIGLDPGCRQMALDDPDLEPLWDFAEISGCK